jgi:hypothetical protein
MCLANYEELLASGLVDAVIIATRNDQHCPLTLAALDRGLHVLCEKPLGLTYADAVQMAARATAQRAICMTPFTYRYMPIYRYLKTIAGGEAIERLYRSPLSSELPLLHWLRACGRLQLALRSEHCPAPARWATSHRTFSTWHGGTIGEITAVCAELGRLVERAPLNPAGKPYPKADDNAMIMLQVRQWRTGDAPRHHGAPEATPFGQTPRARLARRWRRTPCAHGLGREQRIRGGAPGKVRWRYCPSPTNLAKCPARHCAQHLSRCLPHPGDDGAPGSRRLRKVN